MITILERLNKLVPISLAEIDDSKVGLMHRVDTKYLLNTEELSLILESLPSDYKILEVENARISRYETLYFDTEDKQFYLAHHNKRANRFKVRVRWYVENNLFFLEVKEKTNKKITLKKRIQLPFFAEDLAQLKGTIPADLLPLEEIRLKAQLKTIFRRITLVNPVLKERVTIDLDLHLKNSETENEMSCDDLVIVELKRDKENANNSPIIELMKTLHIKEAGFSKYSVGTALIRDDVKKNTFKSRLTSLKNNFHWDEKPCDFLTD
jgi:hypothetical protein